VLDKDNYATQAQACQAFSKVFFVSYITKEQKGQIGHGALKELGAQG
jgi:hypothetical protein